MLSSCLGLGLLIAAKANTLKFARLEQSMAIASPRYLSVCLLNQQLYADYAAMQLIGFSLIYTYYRLNINE